MRVFDCFTFFNEADLLEIRLHELAEVVDFHVVVEATTTFAGRPRALELDLADPRWAPFRDRIVHVIVADMPSGCDAWRRERFQRDAILRGLDRPAADGQPLCGPLDLVIVSDADEILRASAVAVARNQLVSGIAGFAQRLFYYHVNQRAYVPDGNDRLDTETGSWLVWNKARVARRRDLQTPERLRSTLEADLAFVVPDAGWHFSYCGGASRIRAKIAAYAHRELDRPEFTDPAQIEAAIATGADLFGRVHVQRFAPVPLDGTFPHYLLKHRDRFAPLIAPDASSNQRVDENPWTSGRMMSDS
jgi:hypothetical protein